MEAILHVCLIQKHQALCLHPSMSFEYPGLFLHANLQLGTDAFAGQ